MSGGVFLSVATQGFLCINMPILEHKTGKDLICISSTKLSQNCLQALTDVRNSVTLFYLLISNVTTEGTNSLEEKTNASHLCKSQASHDSSVITDHSFRLTVAVTLSNAAYLPD